MIQHLNKKNCNVCGDSTVELFKAKLLSKYHVSYYQCKKCRFLQTEEPYWLSEAYSNSINLSDTGILARNLLLTKSASGILFSFFNRDGQFLDFAGGYGILVRMMRDVGFDFFWRDPFTQNLVARGFENSEDQSSFELVTSIESFEHFVNPNDEIEKMLSFSRNILFTTDILPTPAPKPEDWWYYGLEHGQHISFYSLNSLKYLALKNNLNFLTNGHIHLFTEKKISALKYKTVLKLINKGFFKWVFHHMKSRTQEDMEFIKTHLTKPKV